MLQSQGYSLSDIDCTLSDEKTIINIKGIVSEFSIFESVDSPAVRAEFLITDVNDFVSALRGYEQITLKLKTDSADETYELKHRIYKIGSNIKTERTQQYIIHTVSEAAIINEKVKVFKTFKGPVKNTVQKVLKENLGISKKTVVEDTLGTFPFISPSWRPYDLISYLTDKTIRAASKSSNINQQQSAFLFFENRDAVYFYSIDGLIEKAARGVSKYASKSGTTSPVKVFTYKQKNVGITENGYFSIENITYPDKYDIITQLRSGTLGTSLLGVDPQSINESYLPKSSKTADTNTSNPKGPGGGNYQVIDMTAATSWQSRFSHLPNSENPFTKIGGSYGHGERKRLKFFNSYGWDSSSGGDITGTLQSSNTAPKGSALATGTTNKGGSGNVTQQIAVAALYSLMRYQALNYIKLNIVIPGNTGVAAGDVIEVVIPSSRETAKNLPKESTYSGTYMVLGVVHIWRPEGVSTHLQIGRDSISKK